MSRVTWTAEMKSAITAFREEGRTLLDIAERLGVDIETLRRFRKETAFQMKPIRRSNNRMIGRDAR